MSCSYADGLSPYENKGRLGVAEKFDSVDVVDEKSAILAKWISEARHVVIHSGAGISTTAGIPDFRGPNGVWTLETKGLKPNINISFDDAIPTKTHMAIKKLIDVGYAHYVVSQNIDGLHLKSGLARKSLAELHGNMFIEQCERCGKQFVRGLATTSVGQKFLDMQCKSSKVSGRNCRGKLRDTILDWEHSLPENDLIMSDYHSAVADLNICLGTTLQIVPSGNLPLKAKKFGGKVAIVNLQPTKHDKKADLIINSYVDDVLEKIMKKLGLEIPTYSKEGDPTKQTTETIIFEWTIQKQYIEDIKEQYDIYCKKPKKQKCDSTVKSEDLKPPIKSDLCLNKIENNFGLKTSPKPEDSKEEVDSVAANLNDCNEEEGVKKFIDFS